MRSEWPSSKGGWAREAGVMVKGDECAWACVGVETFVGVSVYADGTGAFAPSVYHNERCSEHHRVRHCPKFKQNQKSHQSTDLSRQCSPLPKQGYALLFWHLPECRMTQFPCRGIDRCPS